MSQFSLYYLLALAPPPGAGGNQTGSMLNMLSLMIFMGVVMYVVGIRPQQKKAKEQALLLKNLRAGDRIITNGGLIATVISVKDKTLSIRSADAKLEILKSSVTEITIEKNPSSSEA